MHGVAIAIAIANEHTSATYNIMETIWECMDEWMVGLYGILSTQIMAISCLKQSLLVRPMACVKERIHLGRILWKRSLRLESCTEILANDIIIYTTDQNMFYS